MWKDFFYFSRNERRGIIVLIILLTLINGGRYWYKQKEKEKEFILSEIVWNEYELFISSLIEKENEKDGNAFQTNSTASIEHQKALYEFDPNTLDSMGVIQLGLSSFATSNIFKYRQKQGRFKRPQDFARIYGISPETFEELLPWIHIKESPKENNVEKYGEVGQKDKEESREKIIVEEIEERVNPFKYAKGITLDLNTLDTTELKKIPGIGSGIAKAIVSYRYKLGGFSTVGQLKDISYISDTLNQWFFIAEDFETKRINLNKASIERINSHPYFNFYQAKVIVEHRKKNGKLKSLKQLSLYEEFSPEDIERIKPYISFE